MKKSANYKWLIPFVLFVHLSTFGFSQLVIDSSLSPDEIAQRLVGVGVDIFNVQVNAADSAWGYYYSTGTELGASEGLILSTGNIFSAIGPNDETGVVKTAIQIIPPDTTIVCLDCYKYDNQFPGDSLLTSANGGLATWDAATFEFDVVAQGDSLMFDFIFASEEYLEWVGSSFNDVFGFFISGPNIGTDVNIALIPGTSTPVAINTVNHIDNTSFFKHNEKPAGQFIQYDGFTKGLRAAVGNIVPCEIYHLKLIIADGSDHIWDSGVFISRIESNPVNLITSTAGGLDYMIEGCNDGSIRFESNEIANSDLEVFFTLGGPASIGNDFITVPDISNTFDSIRGTYHVTIPAGSNFIELGIQTGFDGVSEPINYINFTLVDQLCDTLLFQSSVNFYIIDELKVNVDPIDPAICAGSCVTLTTDALTLGKATFNWSPLYALSDPNSKTPDACPDTITTYTVTSLVANCVAQSSTTVSITDLNLQLNVSDISCSDAPFGAINLTISGGTSPYTYAWTGPNGFVSSDQNISGLEAGEYCVDVFDANNCLISECATILIGNPLKITGSQLSNYVCNEISCFGLCDGFINVTVAGGSGNNTYTWTGPNSFVASTQNISNICAGTYVLLIRDDQGCEVNANWTLTEPDALEVQLDGVVDVLCNGSKTGSACVTSTGGCTPYFYAWSHDSNLKAPCALQLPSDTFYVNVRDINGCSASDSVVIVVGQPALPINVTVDNISLYPGGYNTSCPGSSDASVDVTISGGIPGYTAQWVQQETGDTYFTEDLNNVTCGTYDLTVRDANACIFELQVIVTCVPELSADAVITPNPCNNPNAGLGAINLTPGGGNPGVYTSVWTGPSCSPCLTEDISNLNSGDYNLTLTDAQSCASNFVFSVGTNDSFTVNQNITDAICFGECNGAIDLIVTPVNAYTFDWKGPNGFVSNSQNISALCAGNYTVKVSTGGCEETFIYTVGQGLALNLTVQSKIEPSCFGQNNGAITLATSGGNGAITVNWAPACSFPGGTGLFQNNLFDCSYPVSATDALGCIARDTVALIAPQVMNIFVDITQFDGGYNVSCFDAQDGQISVSVNGGTPDCVGFAPYCYNYDWGNCDAVDNPGSDVQTNLGGGTYCVIVTDSAGCIATTQIPMLEPDSISALPVLSDYNGFQISCAGASDGFIAPNVAGGSGNYTKYEWIKGDIGGNIATADTLKDLSAGIYHLYIEDTNGCSNTLEFELIEPSPIDISVISVIPPTCFGISDGSISVDATGGVGVLVYNFNGPDGPLSGNVITGLSGGTYVLTVSDDNACQAIEIIENNPPTEFNVTLQTSLLGDSSAFTLQCKGDMNGAITSTVSGGIPAFDYLWEDASLNVLGTDTFLTGLGAGNYCLTVTDSINCIAKACIDITEPSDSLEVYPNISVFEKGDNISCFGECDGFIELNAVGGVAPYTFIWKFPGSNDLIADQNIYDLCAGNYEVLVTDANGCDTLILFELIQPTRILPNVARKLYNGGYHVSCKDSCDGQLCTAPSGGYPGYTYLWDDFGTTDTCLTDLCEGLYALTVTDSIGCSVSINTRIVEPDSISKNPVVTDITCFGDGNGRINLNLTGGSGTYVVDWTNTSSSIGIADSLEAGNYCAEIYDNNGCYGGNGCWDIIEPELLVSNSLLVHSTCNFCNGSIEVSTSGGIGDYTYTWTGGVNNPGDPNQYDLCAGDFGLQVADENNCLNQLDLTVNPSVEIGVSATLSHPLCNNDCDGSIALETLDTRNPVLITWFDEGGNIVGDSLLLNNICRGNFSALVIDADSCQNLSYHSIIEPDSILIDAIPVVYPNDYNDGYNVTPFGNNNGIINTNLSGGTGSFNYIWTGPVDIPDGEANPDGLKAGEYTLMVSDENACFKDTLIVLTQPYDLALPTGISPNGDGLNDTYVIRGVEEHRISSFKVFNRWGNLVFERENYAQGAWNGSNNDGQELPDGTYFIIFEADGRNFNTYVDLRR